jgi:hypothetical protein
MKKQPRISEKKANTAHPTGIRQRFANFVIGATLALFPAVDVEAQMNSFVFPPNDFKVTSSPVVINTVNGMSSGSYFMSTGIRDYSGSLRFYIEDDIVFDGFSNTPVGHLQGIMGTGFSPEITIVPIPGGCHNKFYAFYCMADYCSGSPGTSKYEVNYVTIDCSGSVVNVSAPTQLHYKNSGGGAGLAASKLIGTGNSAFHYLYIGEGFNGVFVCKITSAGISTPQNIGFSSSGGVVPKELELSENGEWLAFNASWPSYGNGPASRVSVIQLNPTNYPNQFINYTEYPYYDCKGIEFVGSGTPDLYVCGKGSGGMGANQPAFFDRIDVANQTVTDVLQIPSFQSSNANAGGVLNFNNTFIEYSKSGQICGFCDDGNGQEYFVEYDVTAQTVHGTPVTGSPNAYNASSLNCNYHAFSGSYTALNGTYYMPDQIDGFDYNTIGLSTSMLYVLTVNGNTVSSECGQWTEVYNCGQMLLPEKLFDGIPCGSSITISAYDQECNPVYGSNFFNYSGPLHLQDDGILADRDLRDYKYFEGNREYSFVTMPGYYGISVDFIDCCSKQRIHMQAYVHVLGAVQQGFDLRLFDYNSPGGNGLPVAHTISSPNIVGASSMGFFVNASSITPMNITNVNVLVQEVDNAGNIIPTHPNGVVINETRSFGGSSVLTYIPLNSYCVSNSVWGSVTPPANQSCSNNSGNLHYFSYNAVNNTGIPILGSYYLLTVTLGNPCSSASEWSYIQVDPSNPLNKTVAPKDIMENQVYNPDVKIFPNPTAGEMNINISSNVNDVYTVELFDMVGRKVATLYDQLNVEAGNQNISANVSAIQNGMYLWKISSGNFSKSGTICVSK